MTDKIESLALDFNTIIAVIPPRADVKVDIENNSLLCDIKGVHDDELAHIYRLTEKFKVSMSTSEGGNIQIKFSSKKTPNPVICEAYELYKSISDTAWDKFMESTEVLRKDIGVAPQKMQKVTPIFPEKEMEMS